MALFASGCGDDDSGAPAEITVETSSLSKDEFVKRADQLCEQTRSDFQRAFDSYVKENPNEGAQERGRTHIIREIFVPRYEELIAELASMGAPSPQRNAVAAFLNSLSDRMDEVSDDPKKAFASLKPFAKAEKNARTAGLRGCAESLG